LDQEREACFARIVLYGKEDHEAGTEVSPIIWGTNLGIPEADYGNGIGGPVPKVITDTHIQGFSDNRPSDLNLYNRHTDFENKRFNFSVLPESDHKSGRMFVHSILKRRSRRNFTTGSIEGWKYAAIMDLVMKGLEFIEKISTTPVGICLKFLTASIEGVEDGVFIVDSEKRAIGLIERGKRTGFMASACLEQRWLSNASIHFMMTSDLRIIERDLGTRGYRHIMINAGILGQIIYLAANAYRLGCCGIGAFFDDEASSIIDAREGEYLIYLVAVGNVRGDS
jgi:nitroreductase